MKFKSQFGTQSFKEFDDVTVSLTSDQRTFKGSKEAEQVVKQINQQYDRLMNELKRFKEAK